MKQTLLFTREFVSLNSKSVLWEHPTEKSYINYQNWLQEHPRVTDAHLRRGSHFQNAAYMGLRRRARDSRLLPPFRSTRSKLSFHSSITALVYTMIPAVHLVVVWCWRLLHLQVLLKAAGEFMITSLSFELTSMDTAGFTNQSYSARSHGAVTQYIWFQWEGCEVALNCRQYAS